MDTFLCHTWPSATLERLKKAMPAYLRIRNLSRFLKRDFRTLELAHYQISHLSRDDLYHKAFPEHRGLFWLISHLGPYHLRRRAQAYCIYYMAHIIWGVYLYFNIIFIFLNGYLHMPTCDILSLEYSRERNFIVFSMPEGFANDCTFCTKISTVPYFHHSY